MLSFCPSVVLSMCRIMSTWYLLNCSTFFSLPNLVWWCIIKRWRVIKENWFTIFSVKVTARAYVIKIWIFLWYLQICWSVCSQTLFDTSTTSWAGVSCGKIGSLHSRSRSHWRSKMLVNVCQDGIFWTTLLFYINSLKSTVVHLAYYWLLYKILAHEPFSRLTRWISYM